MKRLVAALLMTGMALGLSLPFSSSADASPRVQGLDHCVPSGACHFGPVFASYPNYANVCSQINCNFVSAANWEEVAVGVTPGPALLQTDYAAAGQTFGGGLSMGGLFTYWKRSGIDGVYLKSWSTQSRATSNVESLVLRQRALLVESTTSKSAFIGSTKFGAGDAVMIVDGFTPKGPLVVFEGRTYQMTWPQWFAQVKVVWRLSISLTPPSTSPTAVLGLSEFTVPSAGATVTLTFTSTNATTCSLSSVPSLWTAGSATVACTGTYRVTVIPASTAQQWIITFTAGNVAGQSATAAQTLTQEAPAQLTPTATLSLSQSNVPSAGATVTLTFTSTNATTCSLSSVPSLWTAGSTKVACTGTYLIKVIPASIPQRWVFTFTAKNVAGQSATATQTLIQTAPPPSAYNSSTNWSGYVVPSSSALITDAQGNFTVPAMNCADTPNGDTSIWVGIGGEQWSNGGNSGTLLQTGVDADCVGGFQQNDAWFEQWPSIPNNAQTFDNFPVFAGDQIQVSVYETTTDQWVTLLSDVNTGESGIMLTGDSWGVGPTSNILNSWTVQGDTSGLSYGGGYTAEWIVEDNTNSITDELNPFANFGSVTWTGLESSFTTWSLTHDETWAIVQNGETLATPTATTSDGFTVGYTGP